MISGVRAVAAAAMAVLTISSGGAYADLTKYYSEDFCLGAEKECFDSGFGLEGQHGWSALPGLTILGNTSGNLRRTGFRANSRGAGFGFERVCQSGAFADVPEPTGEDFILQVVCGFTHARTTWYITPENRSNGQIATRLRFGADGTVAVLIPDGTGGGSFETVPGVNWEPQTAYTVLLIFHDDGRFQLSINDRELAQFEAIGFAVGIEAVGFETGNERIEQAILVDKIQAWRGHLNQ